MARRFTVRPDDDADGQLAVWDGAVHGFRARHLPDEPTAIRTAIDLEIQYDAHGPRPADAVRKLDPPQRVQVRRAEWDDAELDTWVRDAGIWYGRVEDEDGNVRLVPRQDLRKIGDVAADPG
jgi:hypothetical protein